LAELTRRVLSLEDHIAAGKALRDATPLDSHAGWTAHKNRRDPISILVEQNKTRLPALVPIRFGRMMQSPFTFFRGAAAVMAADLAHTPASGIRVQCCGDCHVLNFGGFATPERQVSFDINDFDETLPAPWEWDLKRLATSFVLAGRANKLRGKDTRAMVRELVSTYRTQMAEFARMNELDVWYSKIDVQKLIAETKDRKWAKRIQVRIKKAQKESAEHIQPVMTTLKGGKMTIKDQPPIIFHLRNYADKKHLRTAMQGFSTYRESITEDRRVLFDRFHLVDVAFKAVGIGSVGTMCGVALFMASQNDALFLQIKQANASVLEPYAGKSQYDHHGQRVVMGQRIMQAASDIFLGWATAKGELSKFHCYIRQLRDWKIKPLVETFDEDQFLRYAQLTGWTLARAHARSGKAAEIRGYLGKKDVFDDAMVKFATDYADQSERDHKALVKAIRSGRIKATSE
jgi:uncharacterized protein (DUF2252 family)